MELINPSGPPRQECGVISEGTWPLSGGYHALQCSMLFPPEYKANTTSGPNLSRLILQILGSDRPKYTLQLCHLLTLWPWAIHSLAKQLVSLSEKMGRIMIAAAWGRLVHYQPSKLGQMSTTRMPRVNAVPDLPLLHMPHAPAPSPSILAAQGSPWGGFRKEKCQAYPRPTESEPLGMEPRESFFLTPSSTQLVLMCNQGWEPPLCLYRLFPRETEPIGDTDTDIHIHRYFDIDK